MDPNFTSMFNRLSRRIRNNVIYRNMLNRIVTMDDYVDMISTMFSTGRTDLGKLIVFFILSCDVFRKLSRRWLRGGANAVRRSRSCPL